MTNNPPSHTETQSVAEDSAEAGAGLLVGDWEANLLQSELAGSLSLFGQRRSPPNAEDTMSILASTTHLDLEAGHLSPGALQGLTLITGEARGRQSDEVNSRHESIPPCCSADHTPSPLNRGFSIITMGLLIGDVISRGLAMQSPVVVNHRTTLWTIGH